MSQTIASLDAVRVISADVILKCFVLVIKIVHVLVDLDNFGFLILCASFCLPAGCGSQLSHKHFALAVVETGLEEA